MLSVLINILWLQDFKNNQQDPIVEDENIDPIDLFMIILSLLHFDLNLFKALLRLSCLIYMNRKVFEETGAAPCHFVKDVNRHWYDDKMREIEQAYLNRGPGYKKIDIGKTKPGGGTSDTGKAFKIDTR